MEGTRLPPGIGDLYPQEAATHGLKKLVRAGGWAYSPE